MKRSMHGLWLNSSVHGGGAAVARGSRKPEGAQHLMRKVKGALRAVIQWFTEY